MKIELSEAEYRSVLEAILSPNDYILVADAERRIRTLNRIPFGFPPDRFLGRDFIEFAKPDHQPLVREAAEHILDGAPSTELDVQGTDGRWYLMRIVGSVDHGAVQGFVIYLLDVDATRRCADERANLRTQLESADGRDAETQSGTELTHRDFDRLIDALPVLISYVDREGRYRYNSAAYASWFGRPVGELLGRSVEEVMGAPAHAMVRPYIDRVLAGHVVNFEMRLPFQAAGTRPVAVRFLPDASASGDVVGFYALIEDISGRKDAEAILRQQEDELRQLRKMEALGTLAGSMVHEFNNLLQVMINGCTSLLHASGEESAAARQITPVMRAAQRGASLTRQLLSFSRRPGSAAVSVDLDAQLSDMSVLLAFLLGSGVSLELDLHAGCLVRAEAGLIQQILINLTLNARDAMPEGGALRVSTGAFDAGAEDPGRHPELAPGPYARLSVSDDGIGMDPATRARIFDPFFTTKGADKGTGLGLSTVYGIVRQLGGRIEVESAPGRGTVFHLYLPAAGRRAGAEGT